MARGNRSRLPLLLAALALSAAASPAAAEGETVYPDPGLHNPRVRFHMGDSANGHPKISSVLPDIPGEPSAWYITQWNQSSYIDPSSLQTAAVTGPEAPKDTKITYRFVSSDRHSAVTIYTRNSERGNVYELTEAGGTLTEAGGSDLFLAADPIASNSSFDREISYSLEIKLADGSITYDPDTKPSDGIVMAQIISGFVTIFSDPSNNVIQSVFLQIPLSTSRPETYEGKYFCHFADNRPDLLYSAALLAGEQTLPFAPDHGSLHHIHYNLNHYLQLMVAHSYTCDGKMITWSAAAHDARNWRLGAIYVGTETQIADWRQTSSDRNPKGAVSATLQIANLAVTRNTNAVYSLPTADR